VTALPAISPNMTEPSAIATGPSGNRSPVAITRTSAIAPSSPSALRRILSPRSPKRQADRKLKHINKLRENSG
jgi:hypothetical protein